MRKQAQFRLLVVRLGAMGDILHALPAITALRNAHPGWKIDWVVEPRWLPLLSAEQENALPGASRTPARPVVDQIYLAPVKAWGQKPLQSQTWAEFRELRSDLRTSEYEAVLDLQGSFKSAAVARLSNSHRVIGEAAPREAPAKWFFTERIATTGAHVIEQDLELASAVAGDLLHHTLPMLPMDIDAEQWCDELDDLKSALWRAKPVLLLHPGGGWGAKRWPPERYGAVAEEFAGRGGSVLVNCGPGEEEIAAQVVASSGTSGRVHSVACTLPQLIALTRRVSLVIGGDTGPLHLACALNKPVVGIYGPTDPKRNGPFGTRFRVLRNPESRTDHSRRTQPEAGLLTILPETVISAVVDLMLEVRRARQNEAQTSAMEEEPL